MAEYPCDFHLARYAGPSTRCFLNLYRDNEVVALRASVCPNCLADLVSCWMERALVRAQDGYWNPLDEGAQLEGLWQPQEGTPSPRRAARRY